MHHDIVKGMLRRIVLRAGVASTLASSGVCTAGEVVMALETRMAVVNVSVTHPARVSTRAEAAAAGGAAVPKRDAVAKRDGEKRRASSAGARWLSICALFG
jgi:hypothetical protein